MQRIKASFGLRYLVFAGVLASASLAVEAEPRTGRLLNEAFTQPMEVNEVSESVFANADIINEQDMANLRGGFTIAGIDMNFGATLRTMIDNIRLETVLNITEAGTNVISQTLQNTDAIKNGIANQAQQVTQVGPATRKSVVEVSPEGINVPGLKNFSGAVVQDAKGFSAALHNITRNAILSTVVSNASNRNIRQELDIRLDIRNLEAVRAAQLRSKIANALVR